MYNYATAQNSRKLSVFPYIRIFSNCFGLNTRKFNKNNIQLINRPMIKNTKIFVQFYEILHLELKNNNKKNPKNTKATIISFHESFATASL